jgi:class 3 adenylate cyclase
MPAVGNGDAIIDGIGEFLTGVRPVEVDRVLATILFTDIVGSTERALTLGDRRWRELLDRYYAGVRREFIRFRGRENRSRRRRPVCGIRWTCPRNSVCVPNTR